MTQAKSFLKEIDFTKQELEELIDLSIKFKQLKKERIPHKYLDGLNIALIFEKTSTRTRSAFTVAGQDLRPVASSYWRLESINSSSTVRGLHS